ncbi:AbfB domain-containing protein [Amycolatopsis nigrescens]|uniref:AbfB domain-containing protein n=1 Tax=Amycolatopsis nigrescens TaxID=381445 RepID=UPI000A05BF88|nr:AbfB domain-containing protein [Amycolatopsis nigrescens]
MLASLLAPLPIAAAAAAPAAADSTATQQAAPTAPGATAFEKGAAAAILGITAGPELLVLGDKDFVIAMWRRAPQDAKELRAAAELAFAGSDFECTQYIKTGMKEAHDRDVAQLVRDAPVARMARELKQGAAALLELTVDENMLVLNYRDFIYKLWQRAVATTPKIPQVEAAALAAFDGSEDVQKEFLATGLRQALERDKQAARDALEDATEAEKARLAARDAKHNAAALLGIIATENMLILSDDNFIREIWNRSQPDTEVNAAAIDALRSPDPAVWKRFIDVGIYEAKKRDADIAYQKFAAENRRRATVIQAKAENSTVHPALAAAAVRALAGTDKDVDYFLRIGAALAMTQSLKSHSGAVRSSYIDDVQGLGVVTARDPVGGKPGADGQLTWTIATGLADPGCYSLESATRPGFYLRHQNFQVKVAANDDSQAFARDATWCARGGLVGFGSTFELFSNRARVLRHFDGKLWAADSSSAHPFDNPTTFLQDASWHVDWPNPNAASAVMLRWNNEDTLKTQLGSPTAGEVADGDIRYREFERGRIYWGPAYDTHVVQDSILAVYLAYGGHRSPAFGPPITDQFATADRNGRYNNFAHGGSIYWSAASGAHAVYGGIKAKWISLGAEKSYLGYPISDEAAIPIGRRQLFQGGRIEYNSITGKVTDYRN